MTRRQRASRGQALLEFAMVLPLFILLLLILFDFGRVVYTQHTITEDAREGARVGIAAPDLRLSYGAPPQTPQDLYDQIRSAALRLSQGTGLTAAEISGEAVACTLPATVDATSPSTCFYPDGFDPGDRVVVNITTEVQIVTPVISNLVGGSFTVTATAIAILP